MAAITLHMLTIPIITPGITVSHGIAMDMRLVIPGTIDSQGLQVRNIEDSDLTFICDSLFNVVLHKE